VLKKKEDEDASYKYAAAMSAKTTTFRTGSFEFSSPYVSALVAGDIKELSDTSDIENSKDIIKRLIKIKTDKRWYLWVLISYNSKELAKKLMIVKKSLG